MKSNLLGMLLASLVLVSSARAQNAPFILNEYNAVANNEFLGGAGDTTKTDSFFGRIEGNGGNWLELVVIQDHLDIGGWSLRWLELDGQGDGSAIWDPARTTFNDDGAIRNVSQGEITFNPLSSIWSDLRAGTLITIIEKDFIDEIVEGADPDNDPPVDTGFDFDVSTDASYNPAAGDWDIHISTRFEANRTVPMITTRTNVRGDQDQPGSFSIGSDDWEVRIFNGVDDVFGPIGEAITFGNPPDTFGGVNDREAVELEADPSGAVTVADFDDGTNSTFGAANDFNPGPGSRPQDFTSLRPVIGIPLVGDTNGDGVVDLEDLNNVRNNFGGMGVGDTNGDNVVDLEDLNNVRNNFGAMAAAVPEPAGLALIFLGLVSTGLVVLRRKR